MTVLYDTCWRRALEAQGCQRRECDLLCLKSGFPELLPVQREWNSSINDMCKGVQFSSVAQSCQTLCDAMEPARLLCPRDSPGKNTGEGCHLLFQGISPPRDWTYVSCISSTGRWVLYHWVTREACTLLLSLNSLGFLSSMFAFVNKRPGWLQCIVNGTADMSWVWLFLRGSSLSPQSRDLGGHLPCWPLGPCLYSLGACGPGVWPCSPGRGTASPRPPSAKSPGLTGLSQWTRWEERGLRSHLAPQGRKRVRPKPKQRRHKPGEGSCSRRGALRREKRLLAGAAGLGRAWRGAAWWALVSLQGARDGL